MHNVQTPARDGKPYVGHDGHVYCTGGKGDRLATAIDIAAYRGARFRVEAWRDEG